MAYSGVVGFADAGVDADTEAVAVAADEEDEEDKDDKDDREKVLDSERTVLSLTGFCRAERPSDLMACREAIMGGW